MQNLEAQIPKGPDSWAGDSQNEAGVSSCLCKTRTPGKHTGATWGLRGLHLDNVSININANSNDS